MALGKRGVRGFRAHSQRRDFAECGRGGPGAVCFLRDLRMVVETESFPSRSLPAPGPEFHDALMNSMGDPLRAALLVEVQTRHAAAADAVLKAALAHKQAAARIAAAQGLCGLDRAQLATALPALQRLSADVECKTDAAAPLGYILDEGAAALTRGRRESFSVVCSSPNIVRKEGECVFSVTVRGRQAIYDFEKATITKTNRQK
jgi:hypothetical protein